MTDLIVTVAVTYPDGTVARGVAAATAGGVPPGPSVAPAEEEEEPAFIRRSRIEGMGYR